MDKPTIVCLTPVRNEAWILESFLRCASLWADLIIVADQDSEDDTVAIAKRFPKVSVIRNEGSSYNELSRQTLLVQAARQMVPGPRLLVALDADEAFTANYAATAEWQAMLTAPKGTVIRFQWVNLCPGGRQGWYSGGTFPWGFMDDGAVHTGRDIHSPRVPVPPNAPTMVCDEIKVLHYQFVDPKRMESKHRWYQCFERVKDPARRAINLYDQYHHMDRVSEADLVPVKPEWQEAYLKAGIDMNQFNAPKNGIYWWDPLVLAMFKEHGIRFFAKENIWEDWPRIARELGAGPEFADPRTWFEKQVHAFLRTPAAVHNRFWAKQLKSLLKRTGW